MVPPHDRFANDPGNPPPTLIERLQFDPYALFTAALVLALLLLISTIVGPLLFPSSPEVGPAQAFSQSFQTGLKLVICMGATFAATWAARAFTFLYRRPYLRICVVSPPAYILAAFALYSAGLF